MNTYKLEFTQEQLTTIGQALENLPYRYAAPIINDINKQIQTIYDREDIDTTNSVTSVSSP